MAHLPVVSRTTPLVRGIPPIIPSHEVFLSGHLVFPRKYFDKQKYFAIEVLPPNSCLVGFFLRGTDRGYALSYITPMNYAYGFLIYA